MTWNNDALADLVREDRVDRRVYTDPDIFRMEMERIFHKTWIYLGHESQVRNPGDYFTTHIATNRLIVARHTDGRIHAFHNRCTHRGAEVCPNPEGHTREFICPYHAWTFSTDGSLTAIPLAQGYREDILARQGEFGLEKLARLSSYRGFIFGSMAKEGVDLEIFLPPEVREAFDNMIARAPDGEIELAGGRTIQRFRANWKMQIENSIDLLHPRILHRNAVESIGDEIPIGPDGLPIPDVDFHKSNGVPMKNWIEAKIEALPGGHCWMGGFLPKVDPKLGFGSDDRMRFRQQDEYKALLVARHGAEKTEDILNFNRHNTIVYPNLFVNPRLQQVRFLNPVAVNVTEQHGFVFRYKGAPEPMFQTAIRLLMAANSPASIVTTDDHEVFERMQETLESGSRPWVDWSRGYGQEWKTQGGLTGEGTSEVMMRNQFREWAHRMVGA